MLLLFPFVLRQDAEEEGDAMCCPHSARDPSPQTGNSHQLVLRTGAWLGEGTSSSLGHTAFATTA
jgi:hypothetical protein